MSYNIVKVNEELAINSTTMPDVMESIMNMPLYTAINVPDEDMLIEYNNPVGAYVTVEDKKFRVIFGSDPQLNGFVVKRIMDTVHSDPVVHAWGDWTLRGRRSDMNLVRWLRDQIGYVPDPVLMQCAMPLRYDLFDPIVSKKRHGYIGIVQNSDKHKADLHTPMKPGKAIATMCPEIEPKNLDRIVTEFLDAYAHREYIIKTSSKPDDFRKVYTGEMVSTQNINTTNTYKSLASSCMRYTFDDGDGPMNLKMHPTEVYGSGDFNIIWVEDSQGRIGGRVVVYMKHGSGKPQPSYIYGACQQALDMLQDHLESINAIHTSQSEWDGGKLLAIKDYDTQAYIGPYLDLEPRALDVQLLPDGTKDAEGNPNTKEYLVIDHNGELDANGYCGVYQGDRYTCGNCGDGVPEDESRYSEYTGENYCDCCFHDTHFYCDWSEEYYHNDEHLTVYSLNGNGLKISQDVHENCDGYVWCERESEYWDVDDVFHIECEDIWVTAKTFEEDYFSSDWDGEVYPNSEACLTDDGETISKDEIDAFNESNCDNPSYQLGNDGVYKLVNKEI